MTQTQTQINDPNRPLHGGFTGGQIAPITPPDAQVAQLVEQGTENPRVGGSIPPLGTTFPFKIKRLSWCALAVILVGLSLARPIQAQVFTAQDHKFRLYTITRGLDHPWGLAFLPNGDLIVTERRGRLRRISGGKLLPKAIPGLPPVVADGQGGWLDVVVHPQFSKNRWIYLSYSAPKSDGSATRVIRAKLSDRGLSQITNIFEAKPATNSSHHFGSRLVFDRAGYLFITSGERGTADAAQSLKDHRGKVIRLMDDGRVPKDNPFVGRTDAFPEIYSYGHRNPQGMAMDPKTGAIFTHEHGARGGDEVNLIKPAINYGWPVITHGVSYAGFPIGSGSHHHPDMEQPLKFWVPSIAPSGMAFYTGKAFPKWQGNLFVGALAAKILVRLTVKGKTIISEERLLKDFNTRIRDVRNGPDGFLYLLTDEPNGAVLRLEPVEK